MYILIRHLEIKRIRNSRMKKIFMFLAILGVTTFSTSCSSDDNSDQVVVVDKILTVEADRNSVSIGESVKFIVSLDGKLEKEALLFIKDKKISTPYIFEEEGEFEVVAKKKGIKDSAPVKITVKGDNQAGGEKEVKELVLIPNVLEVYVGGEVTFKVTNGKDEITDAVITQIGGSAVTNGLWKAEKAGIYKFTASKDGFTMSKEVSIVVLEAPEVSGNYIKIGSDKYDVNNADLRVAANEKGQALIFSTASGLEYLKYKLYTHFNKDDFAVIYLAVLLPEDAEVIVWPQDVAQKDIQIIDAFVAKDKKLAANLGEGEEVDFRVKWGNKPDSKTGKGGEVLIEFNALSFEIKYEGEYSGVYAMTESKDTSNESRNINSSMKKFSKEEVRNIKLAR